VKIRVVEDRDRSPLAFFLAEGFTATPPEKWELLFRAFWDENPALAPDLARGWVLVDGENTIRGFIGSVPFRYCVGGAPGMAAASAGWYVQPAFRGVDSLKLVKAFQSQPGIDLFLSTTPNELAVRLFTRMGFSRVPLPYRQAEYWLVVDWQETVDTVARNLIPFMPTGIVRLMAKPIIPLALRLMRFSREADGKSGGSESDFAFTPCSACDPSFTELWERSRSRYSTTLWRDAATLNWLFFSEIIGRQRTVIRCTRRGSPELLGYFAYDVRPVRGHAARVLQLKDFFAPGLGRDFIVAFLRFSRSLAKDMGAAVVHIWPQDRAMDEVLAAELRFKRKLDWPYLVKWGGASRDRKAVIPKEKFVPSPIEPDRGFS
jgi:hypothetical protein